MKKNIHHLHITCCFDNQSVNYVLSLLKIFGRCAGYNKSDVSVLC